MTTTTKPRYRWSHPSEWLDEYLEKDTHDRDDLIRIAQELAAKLDGDQLQEIYQTEMDEDGYFHDLNLCPDCDTPLTDETTSSAYPSYCATCDNEVELP